MLERDGNPMRPILSNGVEPAHYTLLPLESFFRPQAVPRAENLDFKWTLGKAGIIFYMMLAVCEKS